MVKVVADLPKGFRVQPRGPRESEVCIILRYSEKHCDPLVYLLSSLPLWSISFSVGGSFIIQAASFGGRRCRSGMKHLGKQNVQVGRKCVTAQPSREKLGSRQWQKEEETRALFPFVIVMYKEYIFGCSPSFGYRVLKNHWDFPN